MTLEELKEETLNLRSQHSDDQEELELLQKRCADYYHGFNRLATQHDQHEEELATISARAARAEKAEKDKVNDVNEVRNEMQKHITGHVHAQQELLDVRARLKKAEIDLVTYGSAQGTWQVSLEKGVIEVWGYYYILVVSCFMWSRALES